VQATHGAIEEQERGAARRAERHGGAREIEALPCLRALDDVDAEHLRPKLQAVLVAREDFRDAVGGFSGHHSARYHAQARVPWLEAWPPPLPRRLDFHP
jgi:hypothetical protein